MMKGLVLAVVALVQVTGAGAVSAQIVSPTPAGGARPLDARFACATVMTATKVDGDPNAAVVHIIDPPGPTAGTMTAYGSDQTWSGTVGRSVLALNSNGANESSLVVRAPGPIEAITYAPTWAPCTLKTAVYPAPRLQREQQPQRPMLALYTARPLQPATCAHPYVPATVLRAIEPDTPRLAFEQNVNGTVRVRVVLDENGTPVYGRVMATPSEVVNAASMSAALHSQYAPAIFRCARVASGYDFSVDFASSIR